MMSIVRRRRLARAVQARELGGADLLGTRGAGHASGVIGPALLCRAAAGRQEALGHVWSGRIAPLTDTSRPHRTCIGGDMGGNRNNRSQRNTCPTVDLDFNVT